MDLNIEYVDGWWCVIDSSAGIIDGFDCESDAHLYAQHLTKEDECISSTL